MFINGYREYFILAYWVLPPNLHLLAETLYKYSTTPVNDELTADDNKTNILTTMIVNGFFFYIYV